MKEFGNTLSVAGLRSDPASREGMSLLRNLQPDGEIGQPPSRWKTPSYLQWLNLASSTWPLPQVLRGKNYTFTFEDGETTETEFLEEFTWTQYSDSPYGNIGDDPEDLGAEPDEWTIDGDEIVAGVDTYSGLIGRYTVLEAGTYQLSFTMHGPYFLGRVAVYGAVGVLKAEWHPVYYEGMGWWLTSAIDANVVTNTSHDGVPLNTLPISLPGPYEYTCTFALNAETPVKLWIDGVGVGGNPDAELHITDLSFKRLSQDCIDVSTLDEETLTSTVVAEAGTGGGFWHCADFGNVYVLANGSTNVMRHYDSDPEVADWRVIVSSVRLGTVCAYNQTRLVFGDVDAGQNYIGWSSYMGEDIPYIANGETLPTAWAKHNESELGIPVPFRGQVHRVLQLGDLVIAYGANGVCALRPNSRASYDIIPVEGLGTGIGVLNRACADGDDDGHLFVAQDHSLWFIRPDGKAQWLRRSEFIDDCGATAVLVFDPALREWHISGSTAGNRYVWTLWGLGGPCRGSVTGTLHIGDDFYVSGIEATGANPHVELWSGQFSLNERGRKTVTGINVESYGLTTPQVGVKYRFNTLDSLTQSKWVKCGTSGAGRIKRNFVDGMAGFKGYYTEVTGATVSLVDVRYQFNDRRFRRGTAGIPGNQPGVE